MAPVIGQEFGEAGQVTIGQGLFIYLMQYTRQVIAVFIDKCLVQVAVECLVEEVLQYLAAHSRSAAFIAQYIA
ncbi:hypothetical protein D3C80_1588470 [compost metagenome]